MELMLRLFRRKLFISNDIIFQEKWFFSKKFGYLVYSYEKITNDEKWPATRFRRWWLDFGDSCRNLATMPNSNQCRQNMVQCSTTMLDYGDRISKFGNFRWQIRVINKLKCPVIIDSHICMCNNDKFKLRKWFTFF